MKKNIAIVITRLDLGGAQKVTALTINNIILKGCHCEPCTRVKRSVQGEAIAVFDGGCE